MVDNVPVPIYCVCDTFSLSDIEINGILDYRIGCLTDETGIFLGKLQDDPLSFLVIIMLF